MRKSDKFRFGPSFGTMSTSITDTEPENQYWKRCAMRHVCYGCYHCEPESFVPQTMAPLSTPLVLVNVSKNKSRL